MNDYLRTGFGLGALPLLSNAVTRSISAENPTGEKGKAGMAIPDLGDPGLPHSGYAVDLGQGWKVRPFEPLPAGQTVTLMDVAGPGVIQHIWMTSAGARSQTAVPRVPSYPVRLSADPVRDPDIQRVGRAIVLRFYWDGEDNPSIEVPTTDFFAIGHDLFARVNSLAVVTAPQSATNCYWPMPYRKGVRVTATNEFEADISLAYQMTYAQTEVPEEAAYLHAQWRRAVTDRDNPDYVILDNVKGRGRYVGTFLAWTQLSDGWFGEGEIKFYMDGDRQFPTICGTGTEDYFCGSFGFPEVYTTPYVGSTLKHPGNDGPPKWSLYRWHIMDPVCFREDLRVTIQALGWWPTRKFQPLADDIASVAYWYQKEPHAGFPEFPALEKRWPR